MLRIAANSSISLLNLTDAVTQLQLAGGTLIVHVRQLNDDESYEIDTPNVAFSILRPGTYRLSVDPSGNFTTVAVRGGQGEVTGAGVAYAVRAHENVVFSGADQLTKNAQAEAGPDEFERWCGDRDVRWERSEGSARYVSPDVDWLRRPRRLRAIGTRCQNMARFGFPRDLPPGWVPYREGPLGLRCAVGI